MAGALTPSAHFRPCARQPDSSASATGTPAWTAAWTAAWHLPGRQIRHQSCKAACPRDNRCPRADETVFVRKTPARADNRRPQNSLRACPRQSDLAAGGRARWPGPHVDAQGSLAARGRAREPRLSLRPQNRGGLQWPGALHRPWAPGVFWLRARRVGQCFFPASPPTGAWCGACTAQKAASAS